MIEGLAGIFRGPSSGHRFSYPRKVYGTRHVSAILFSISMEIVSQTVLAKEPVTPLVDTGALLPSKSVFVFGRRIVYYDVGSGSTVVLLHGFGSQAMADWGRVIRPLSQGHRVIALDQIGFGESDKPLVDYSIQTFVDFLGEFLRTLGVKQFSLAGESLGGWIAASYSIQALASGNTGQYALAKPERLILADALGQSDLRSGSSLPIAGSLRESAGVAIIFHDKSRVTEDFVRHHFEIQLKANDGATQRSLWSNPQLASEIVGDRSVDITIPTLIVWGANDEVIPLAQGREYAAKIPHAKLVIIPDCGHVPPIEKPEAFLSAVIPFLN
jgi:pimeloyl-ACP methyl ester carboxylesterase